jgi:hypothetical protein
MTHSLLMRFRLVNDTTCALGFPTTIGTPALTRPHSLHWTASTSGRGENGAPSE